MQCDLHQSIEEDQKKINDTVLILTVKFDNMIARITEFVEKTELVIDKLKEGHDVLNARLTDKIEHLRKDVERDIKTGDDKVWNRLNEFSIHFDTYKLEDIKRRSEERILYDEKLSKMDKRILRIFYTGSGILFSITMANIILSIIKNLK